MPPIPNGQANINSWLADEIGNVIASGCNLTVGTNFFVGEYPEEGIDGQPTTNGLYLIEMQGSQPDQEIDTEYHVFSLYSSSSDTTSAYSLLHQAYDILERRANFQLVNWYVYLSYSNSTIRDEGRGREGNKLFSLSFTLICRNLNNIS